MRGGAPAARLRAAACIALACAAGLAFPAAAHAQRAISPRLAAFVGRDTTLRVWVIARPGDDLDALAAALTRLGGQVRVKSRFVGAVSADLPGTRLRDAARLAGVRRVQPVAVYVRRPVRWDTVAARPARPFLPAAPAPDSLSGPLAWVMQLLHVDALQQRGLRGTGVRIAMLDAGFDTRHPLMAGVQVAAQYDFVYHDTIVRDEPGETQGEMTHGTATWSTIAANVPGTLYGVAPGATFLLAKTEYTPTETRTEEDNWVAAIEWADSLHAAIVSSSLGYLSFDNGFTYTPSELNGDFAVTSIAAHAAAARGMLVVVSVGNEGPAASSEGTPADADSIVAAGAVDSLGALAAFSSRGPTADGRIKPEVVAPGVDVPAAAPGGGIFTPSGTSFSAPLVAGIAALVQATRPPGSNPVDLREGLMAASSQHLTPDNNGGWGIPDARAVLAWPHGLRTLGAGDTLLASAVPTLAWDGGAPPSPALIGPSLYRVRVARDALFAKLLVDTSVIADSVTLTPLAPGTRLFWKVIGYNGDLAVTESTAVRGPDVVPQWVTQLTLAAPAGQSIRDSLPLFAWHAVPVPPPYGPMHFDVDVYPASRTPAEAVASARGLTDTTFVPAQPLERNLPYRWRVVARLATGDSSVVVSRGTFVVLDESAPSATVLFQNFPNPFPNAALGVSSTCIWFDVGQTGPVQLAIYDLRGRLMRVLTPSAANGLPPVLPAGRYGRPPIAAPGTCDPRFTWDGRDETGAYVRPGVYLYRLTAPGFRESRHVVFLGAP